MASLIYDKRGAGESTGRDALKLELLVGDALAALRCARGRNDVDPRRVGLAGFSQGGWVAPAAAAADVELALMVGATPGITVREILRPRRVARQVRREQEQAWREGVEDAGERLGGALVAEAQEVAVRPVHREALRPGRAERHVIVGERPRGSPEKFGGSSPGPREGPGARASTTVEWAPPAGNRLRGTFASSMRHLSAEDVRTWVQEELLSPTRSRPIVAVTTYPSTGRFLIAPSTIEERIGKWADVVALDTGDPTWELADALPDRLDVYGGAMRVWWPGLTRESDPYDHRLYLLRSEDDALRRLAQLEGELRRGTRAEGDGERGRPRSPATRPAEEAETVTVSVTSTSDAILVEDGEGVEGRITEADVPLEALAVCLREGLELTVSRPLGWQPSRGRVPCSLRGQLPPPWSLVGSAIQEGDVVQGRVVAIKERYALIELVPGAKGIVGLAEVDHTFVRDIGDFLAVGELVPVQVLDLDADGGRAQLSVKAAQSAPGAPRPLPSLVPGGEPFDWPAFLERAGVAFRERRDERDERIEELGRELAAANEDRAALRRSLADLRREKRGLEDRYDDLERRTSGELDPLSDERAFLRAVRVEYARDVGEGERLQRPLQAMRVGPRFLETARSLQGVSVQKIVEVAAQVACEKAHEIEAREVHPLGESGSASRPRVRARDGAKAWRCALQVKTPSARRLHWWRIPGPDGATIEFASVVVHDDYGIPEG